MLEWIALAGITMFLVLCLWHTVVSVWLIHANDRALALWYRLERGYLPEPDDVARACESGMDQFAAACQQVREHAHRPLGLTEMLAHVDRCLAQMQVLLGDWRLRLLLPAGDDFCAAVPEPTFLAARHPSSRRLRLLALIERLWRPAAGHVLYVNPRLRWVEQERAWMGHEASARNAAWHIHVTVLHWGVRVARWTVWGARFTRPEKLPRRLLGVYNEVGLLLHECCDAYTALSDGFVAWRGTLNPARGA